jgi:two-component system response regulator QseB
MHVLLVEDDSLLGQAIEMALARWSHTSVWVRDGAAALAAARTSSFDLIVLDLGLPRVEGLDVLKTLRAELRPVPVLIMTARDTLTDRVRGLDAGADDYLNKPFHLEELAARMRALHRRALGQSQNLILVGSLSLDPISAQVSFEGQTLELSHREFVLLRALAERAGRAVSREVLIHALYGAEGGAESNSGPRGLACGKNRRECCPARTASPRLCARSPGGRGRAGQRSRMGHRYRSDGRCPVRRLFRVRSRAQNVANIRYANRDR